MKLLSKIVWAEGMYLAPHHFQAQSRYFEEAMHFATQSLWNDAYGFADRELNADALRNGAVELLHARGIFEDGLVFDMPECDPLPEPCKIDDKFPPTADHVTVALAVPRWTADAQNCDLENTPDGTTRYTRVVEVLHDENTGRDDKPVDLGRKNIRLVIEGDDAEQGLTLPLARVVRDGSGHFVFDPTFIAPSVRLAPATL